MIPPSCKRLAEVDFPIAVVSAHSAREKSIRHGHPSTLHLWWARRPLAACRAMLLALLLPDPCDENCPAEFKEKARALLSKLIRGVGKEDIELRRAILRFIGDFANWDYAANPTYLEVGRGLVKAAHGEEAPLVVDPFAGGGSIPLEALRLGCDAFASDLNPVACLILKVMLEDIPRHGPELAEELRRVGAKIKKQAEKELAEFYPCDPDGATPIAYLWARTVRCESPNCGAEIPLVRSFWLCKKASRLRALRYEVKRPKGKPPYVEFEVFTPKSEKEVASGTVNNARATCMVCDRVLAAERVRAQLSKDRGGTDVVFGKTGDRVGGARLLAVVTVKDDKTGRQYRPAVLRDYESIRKAQKAVAKLGSQKLSENLSSIPDESISPIRPSPNARGLSAVTRYGMSTFADLFAARQKLALSTFTKAIAQSPERTQRCLAAALSRSIDYWSSLVRWVQHGEFLGNTFTRQAAAVVWDFCEGNPLSQSTGGYSGALNWIAAVIENGVRSRTGQVHRADACEIPLPDESADCYFTDPPYYDAIPYADLSDFFFVWLKRVPSLNPELQDPYEPANPLTPKARECVWNQAHLWNGRSKDGKFFELRIEQSFREGRRLLRESGIGAIVFAHQTTEGWEALLAGIVRGKWTITASWPIATEMAARARARETASLATSIHLVCRPRPENADIGDWGEVFRELPNRIGDWMERLSSEGVRGADLVFACIGPAMEVYSRYGKVEDAEGREIPLGGNPEATEPHKRGFLAYVWEIVGRTALGQVLGTAEARARNGAAGALEEDARLTALFLWTLQSTRPVHNATISYSGTMTHGGTPASEIEAEETETESNDDDTDDGAASGSRQGPTLIYDVVRRFSQPLGIHLQNWDGRIIETKKGIVRLLPVKERAEHLLGEDGASGVADVIERSRGGPINYQFGFMDAEKRAPKPARDGRKRGKATPDEAPTVAPSTTTLDRVHVAMLLQASGKSNALRTMLKAEVDRGPDFLRLANALSALYPKDSEEKRLVDAMLLAVPK
jgi:putative DNA methylase